MYGRLHARDCVVRTRACMQVVVVCRHMYIHHQSSNCIQVHRSCVLLPPRKLVPICPPELRKHHGVAHKCAHGPAGVCIDIVVNKAESRKAFPVVVRMGCVGADRCRGRFTCSVMYT